MPQANCKGCERRHVGCHAHCEIYQEYRKKQDAYLKAKNLYREAEALEMKRIIDKAAMHAMKEKAGIR
ncbi:MAG: hypothetical protein IIU95_02980 [Phascolarctobacterium sp.]|nr:hypothetical protein [Phascolarctobacterium sp.]